jgi:protein TonB
VVLRAIIGKDERVEQLEAISGPLMLKGAALDAVKHWTYKPYLLNGQPTKVDTTVIVHFNLNEALDSAPAAKPN